MADTRELQETLATGAWDDLSKLKAEGKLILPNGKVIEPSSGEYVRLLQWLASLKAKKPKAFPPVKDDVLKHTD